MMNTWTGSTRLRAAWRWLTSPFTNLIRGWRLALALTCAGLALIGASFGVTYLAADVQLVDKHDIPPLPRIHRSPVRVIYEDTHGQIWAGLEGDGVYQYDERQGRWESKSAGLPEHASVPTLQVDAKGELWAGVTNAGAYRYDEFKRRWEIQSAGLPGQASVQTLLRENDGHLWAGLDGEGVYQYDEEQGQWKAQIAGLPVQLYVVSLQSDSNGRLWAGSSFGGALYRFDEGQGLWEIHSDGLPEQTNVQALQVDSKGQLWVGVTGGVYRYDEKLGQWGIQNNGLPEQASVQALQVDGHARLWAGVAGGAYRYDEAQGGWEIQSAGLPELASVTVLHTDSNGQLRAGIGAGGVYLYDEGQRQWKAENTELPEQANVRTLQIDGNGHLWAGIDEGGLYRYDEKQRQWEAQSAGLPRQAKVRTLQVDSQGQLWAGVKGAGAYRHNEVQGWWEAKSAGLPDQAYVTVLQPDSQGQLWAGIEMGGFYRYDDVQERWAIQNAGLPDQASSLALLMDNSGQLWAGIIVGNLEGGVSPDSFGNGMYRYDAVQGRWESKGAGLPEEPYVMSLLVDQEGELWVGLGKGEGAYLYDARTERWSEKNAGFPEQVYIPTLITYADGQLWAGLSDAAGIYRYNREQQRWEAQKTGLPEAAYVWDLLADDKGQLWAGLVNSDNSGVYSYDAVNERWNNVSAFIEPPTSIFQNPEEDLIIGFENYRPMRFSVHEPASDWGLDVDAENYSSLVVSRSSEEGVGLNSSTREVPVLPGDPRSFRYNGSEIWYSQDEIFWNPVAHLDEIPLGARWSSEDKQVTIWANAEPGILEQYTFSLPWYVRWEFLAVTLAIGRSYNFIQAFLAVATAYFLYLFLIYVLAGSSNEISARKFLHLDWNSPKLLTRLLSRGKDSYTAMRLTLNRLDSLDQLLFLFMQPQKTYSPEELVEALRKHDVSPTVNDVHDSLRQLTRQGLMQPIDSGYAHAEPDMGKVYQQTCAPAYQQELTQAVRRRDPVAIDASAFFEQAGFLVIGQFENNLILQPQSRTRQEQFKGKVLARILSNQVLRPADVRAIVQQIEKGPGEISNLDKHIVFIVINQPADLSAYAQMDSYRWGENVILIALTHQRLRAALAESVCEMELNTVLTEYLTENPDLFNQRNPVRDEHYFGRNKDQQILLSYPNQGQPLGIFALNKMGKTSFINNLAERMTDRAVVVIDLQKVAKNARAVYTSLVSGLVRDIGRKWHVDEFPNLRLTDQENPSGDLAVDFGHDLEELQQILARHTPEPRFVIFIDEIDRLIPGEDAELAAGFEGYGDLLSTLRGISQTGLPLTFIVIGVQAHINRKAQLAGMENAGFSVFEEYFLPPLERDECDLMVSTIGRKMGLAFSEAALARIYWESGGHPFLARQLCSLAWRESRVTRGQEGLIELDESQVLQAVSSFVDDRGRSAYYKELYQTRLAEEEQQVVLRLAAQDGPTPGQKGEFGILSDLSQRHIVVQSEKGFQLAFGMFRRWLRREVLELEHEE